MLDRTASFRINLDHRTDRLQECLANQRDMGFSETEVRRVPARLEEGYGILGCAKSHLKACMTFLVESDCDYGMILEDDFDLRVTRGELDAQLRRFDESGTEWDVIVFAASKINAANSDVPGFARVFESLTASGYILKRAYVPTLANCLLESVAGLEKFRHFTPRELIVSRFANDVMWHRLQRIDNWFMPLPAVGGQRVSYSDIEGKVVDYSGVSM
ncbi:hypothetical protein [Azospirillum sp. sgz301742]